jgi:hypothetical protein
MSNPNNSKRDPITSKGASTGSPKMASAGRIRSINGGQANFTKRTGSTGSKGDGGSWPVPNSPYAKD